MCNRDELKNLTDSAGFDKSKQYGAIESFVDTHPACEVERHYVVASEKEDWEMAIQTNIACGDRKDLEDLFPAWAGCNPANHIWP